MIWSPVSLEISRRVTDPLSKFLETRTEGILSSFYNFFWSLVFCPLLAVFMVIVVHELGHLLAGWSVGFRFISIRFGPIQIVRPFRISLARKDHQRAGASGSTGMFPTNIKGIRVRMLTMVLGGPTANLLCACAVILIVPGISIFRDWFVLLSLLTGIGNLIPFNRLSHVSDGRRILMLLNKDGRGERWLAIIQLASDLRNGVAIENLRPEFIAMAVAIRDDSPDTVIGHSLAYAASWYTDTDDETARLLETCLRYSPFAPLILREAILSDAGVFQGRKRKRDDLAREWLADLPAKTELPGLRLRVEAAILEAKDDFQGSLNKLDEVVSATLTLPDRPQRTLSLKLLQRWRSELQEKLLASQRLAPNNDSK
jgi:Zn-dependent protease